MVPSCDVIDANGEILGTYNFPVGGHLAVEDGQTINTGEVLVKIPRAVGGAGENRTNFNTLFMSVFWVVYLYMMLFIQQLVN